MTIAELMTNIERIKELREKKKQAEANDDRLEWNMYTKHELRRLENTEIQLVEYEED